MDIEDLFGTSIKIADLRTLPGEWWVARDDWGGLCYQGEINGRRIVVWNVSEQWADSWYPADYDGGWVTLSEARFEGGPVFSCTITSLRDLAESQGDTPSPTERVLPEATKVRI